MFLDILQCFRDQVSDEGFDAGVKWEREKMQERLLLKEKRNK
jgi:hypothetical protein